MTREWHWSRHPWATLLHVLLGASLLMLEPIGQQNTSAQEAGPMKWVSVREIYSKGKHNAWPDICRWKDKYYVVFNAHGSGHAETDHGIVVMSSPDGDNWETILDVPSSEWQVYEDEKRSAVCPKLFPTENRLHVVFWCYMPGETDVAKERKEGLKKEWLELGGSEESFERWVNVHQTHYRTGIIYTEDGVTWGKPQPLLEPGWWTGGKPHTFEGRHYLVGYRCHAQQWEITPELKTMIPRADSIAPLDPRRGKGMEMFQSLSLFASEDGLNWEKVADIAADDNDETDFDFAENGRILVVCRNGAALKHALAYVGDPPYREWRKLQLSETIHSPAVLRLGERWLVAGRYIDEAVFRAGRFDPSTLEFRAGTRLWFLDEQTGELTDVCTLPSWGDCAYPGMVLTPEGDLLVVYYSASGTTEENSWIGGGPYPGKYSPASIYVARVKYQ